MRKRAKSKSRPKPITAAELEEKFDRGEDVTAYFDWDNAVVVRKVNVDFPSWMVDDLDKEARKLNISRQAVIKTWIRDRLDPKGLKTRGRPKT